MLERERGEDARAIDGLFDALSGGQGDGERAVLDWARIYAERGKARQVRDVLERGARAYPASETMRRALAALDVSSATARKTS